MSYQAASSNADASPSQATTAFTTREPSPQESQENRLKEYATLRVHAINAASTYRNLGILYHSLPPQVIFNNYMPALARSCARLEFTIIDYRELPWMIQSIGVIDHTLRQVSVAFRAAPKPDDFAWVERRLLMVAMWLQEVNAELLSLHQIMAEYVGVRAARIFAHGLSREEQEKPRKKSVAKEVWSDALPSICWEMLSEKEDIWDVEATKEGSKAGN